MARRGAPRGNKNAKGRRGGSSRENTNAKRSLRNMAVGAAAGGLVGSTVGGPIGAGVGALLGANAGEKRAAKLNKKKKSSKKVTLAGKKRKVKGKR